MPRELIKKVNDDSERAFYGSKEVDFEDVRISGPEDGESAFKESEDITVTSSLLDLRYPFWHNRKLQVKRSVFNKTARAPFWYCNDVEVEGVESSAPKAFRECEKVSIKNSTFYSEEIFWRIKDLKSELCQVNSVYAFFQCENLEIKCLTLKGKYSFQYVKNATIEDSFLDTKDALWHSENVTIKNTIIRSEYLGWYSKNLTLINCVITGTQPLCYCENLRLIDCTMADCDLAFENSEVNGNVKGQMTSIKNPRKGTLYINAMTKYIINQFDKSNGEFQLLYLPR